MSSPQPAAAPAASRVSPDEGVLKALRALVEEQTRFLGQSVALVKEASVPQPWTLTEQVALFSGVHSWAINGSFLAQAGDVSVRHPESSALDDVEAALAQGMARMGRTLAKPDSTFFDVVPHRSGPYLGLRRHWSLSDCLGCSGRGRNTCQTCSGSCRVNCSRCYGRRQMPCGCLNGRVSCTRCHGTCSVSVAYQVNTWVYNPTTGVNDSRSHTDYRTETCPACSFGYNTCPRCTGQGHITCSGCSGSGQETCGGCSGQGYLRCAPCAATGKVGTAAQAQVTVTHHSTLTWAEGCADWVEPLAAKLPLAEVLSASENVINRSHAQQGDDAFLVVRQGTLPADHAVLRCDGTSFDAIAYGTPRRWWTGPAIVERLLQKDVRTLKDATASARTGRFKVNPEAVLNALSHVAQSPAHTTIVVNALGEHVKGHAIAHPEGVSEAYANDAAATVSEATRLVQRTMGLDWAVKVAAATAIVGLGAWVVLGVVGAALVIAALASLGVVLRQPVTGRRLQGVFGSLALARQAQQLAGHDQGRSWAIAGGASVALVALMGGVLPMRGPLQPDALRLPTFTGRGGHEDVVNAPSAIRPALTVAQALKQRQDGHLFAAREALQGFSGQHLTNATGALAWMVLQGEGQVGFMEGTPPEGMGDRSIRVTAALPLVDQAVKANDPWGWAAQGVLLLRGAMMVPRDERRGIALLQRAAEQGVPPAQVQMGRIAELRHNPKEARRWFTAAASAGDPQALYDLGTMAWNGEDGKGVGRDAIEAGRLWRQAETQGGALTHVPSMGVAALARR